MVIKDDEVYRMARQLAELTGESLTGAVKRALREQLAREQRSKTENAALLERLREIAEHCAQRPVLDVRGDDEIVGHD